MSNTSSYYAGANGGSISVYDEGNLVSANVTGLNFIGQDVNANLGQNGNTINVYIPSVIYASYFNQNTTTNAILSDVATESRWIAKPSNNYKIGNWVLPCKQPATNNGILVYQTNDYFSCVSNTTYLNIKVLDDDDTTTLSEVNHVLDGLAGAYTSGNTTIETIDFQPDTNKFKAKVKITIDITSLLPNGGRFSVVITHNDDVDGVFTKEQRNLFYDKNVNKATIGQITLVENGGTIITNALSGVFFYSNGSQFNVNINDIDNINDSSYKDSVIEIDGHEYAVATSYLNTGNLTNWTIDYNDIDDNYSGLLTINQNGVFNSSSNCKVRSRTKDWTDSVWIETIGDIVNINTLVASPTRIYEDFRSETYRLKSDYTVWDDTQPLNTYDNSLGLQTFNDRLIYPSKDFSTFKPYTMLQPNYSGLTGERSYIRRFWHTGISHSNALFKILDTNITEADLTNKDFIMDISLNGIDWFSCNGDYVGGSISNGSLCRINKDTKNMTNNTLQVTLGTGKFTDSSTGGSWGIYIRIKYANTTRGKALYMGSIEITDWI